jgi:hypothetical protein
MLKGGALQLRDDGTVRLHELDARWDKLDFTLGVTIPEMSLGGGVVDLGGVTVNLPGVTIFSGDPAVAFSVHLAPFVKHELSLIASPLIQYFKPGTTPIGPDCQKLHAALSCATTSSSTAPCSPTPRWTPAPWPSAAPCSTSSGRPATMT